MLAGLLLMATTAAHAQMDNVVEVENSYQPVVKDANKINLLPEVETPTIKHYDVNYAETLFPTGQYVFQPVWAAASDATALGDPRGFVTLAGGNHGNLNARAAYGLRFTPDDLLDIDLSTSGFNGKVTPPGYESSYKWKSRFYTTKGSLNYEHKLNQWSSLLVGTRLESQVFNYAPALWFPTPADPTNKQHNWLADIDLRLTPYRFGQFSLGTNIGFNLFNQKYKIYPQEEQLKENQLYGGLDLGLHFSEEQAVGLDLAARHYHYGMEPLDDYNSFTLTPHYDLTTQRVTLRTGAQFYFTTGFEKKFRIAPDVSLRFHAEPTFDIFAEATGGEVANDFRHFSSVTPYWEPVYEPVSNAGGGLEVCQLAHEFDQLRSRVGLEWKLAEGLQAIIYGGYDIQKNRVELNANNQLYTVDGKCLHGNIDVDFRHKNLLNILVQSQLNKWTTDDEDDLYVAKAGWHPILDLRSEATVQIVEGLHFGLDYTLQTFSRKDGLAYRRPTTSDLGASLTWRLPVQWLGQHSTTSVFVHGDNLLNKRYDHYCNYRALGTNFLAGVALTF